MVQTAPIEVLTEYGLQNASVTRVPTGLIHHTFRLQRPDGSKLALQKVSPIFSRAVQADIAAVTEHLASLGILTPRLVRTRSGALDVEHRGDIWRVMTWLDGEVIERISAPFEARAAGAILGRFHAALATLSHAFMARRLGVHDTQKHLAALNQALAEHPKHRLQASVAPLAEELFRRARSLPDLTRCPERVVHGDPKITNVIFEPERHKALALIDLDTVAPMRLPLELGDAFRSWCNPSGEDATEVHFDLEIFREGALGYAESARGMVTPEEIEAIAPATGMIMLELSARFLADALNERYFGWSPERFPARGEHNFLRGQGQLRLAQDFFGKRREAERAVLEAFGPAH